MIETAYISIGSNLGDREKNLREAASRMGRIRGIELRRASSLYYTEPVGGEPQPWYFNAVQEVETALVPDELFRELQGIEAAMGRTRGARNAPRIIDLDILLFGARVIRSDLLTVPHPRLPGRRFVLDPLAEISKDIVCPGAGGTVEELVRRLTDTHKVFRKGPFHER
ncbi:MAG: 2-amino-4-hydroxy-6-hydroxymethyldihydropteridine diphosphokinase [Candidatus Aureabacteria bacterium]|nr:2-amino-4-hydroxy-6-hydroxymethyldihydropteridine diphosphokinase [Candidatus Auribacterota bacterium]